MGSSNQLIMPIILDVGQYHDLMSGDVIGLYIMSKPTLNHMLHVRFFTLYTIFVTEDKNRARHLTWTDLKSCTIGPCESHKKIFVMILNPGLDGLLALDNI